jgi:hypothetical protein
LIEGSHQVRWSESSVNAFGSKRAHPQTEIGYQRRPCPGRFDRELLYILISGKKVAGHGVIPFRVLI